MAESTPFVVAYVDLLNGSVARFMQLSEQVGGDVKTQANMVNQVFQSQKDFIKLAAQCHLPSQNELIDLLKPMSEKMLSIQDFRERNRPSKLFNHLSAISESISALGWVTVSPTPAPYIKEMIDAGQFYSNRVLMEYKEKDKVHIDWVKSWMQILNELQQYVKQYHTTGLTWNVKGVSILSAKSGDTSASSGSKAPPPPPPGPPPPPPPFADELLGNSGVEQSDTRAALFQQLNQGEDITKSLKKVTADQQTHKNPNLRIQTALPYKSPVSAPKPFKAFGSDSQSAKSPKFELQGKKWVIEFHAGNKNLVVSNVEMNQTVYVYHCSDCVVQVKGKLNSITLDECKKTSVVFEDIVSSVEFVNCQRIQAQTVGKVPTILIDKTDGVQIYLSKDSLSVEIVSSKSSEMNLMIPKDDGDFVEYPIPEQFKTTLRSGGLVTEAVEQKG